MLETTYLTVLALGHLAVIAAVLLGFREEFGPVVVGSALLGFILFGMAAMGATNVEVVTETGETVRNPQPGLGYYAMGMALVSGILTLFAGLATLASEDDSPYDNPY